MKIKHRTPGNWWTAPVSADVSPDYEAEVQRDTTRAENNYRHAQERLARAEARLAKAQAAGQHRRRIAELQALVELRRAELDAYRRQMTSVPASAQHRGRRSYRPVPPTQGNPIGS